MRWSIKTSGKCDGNTRRRDHVASALAGGRGCANATGSAAVRSTAVTSASARVPAEARSRRYADISAARTMQQYTPRTRSAAGPASAHVKTASDATATLRSSATARIAVERTHDSVQQPASRSVSTPCASSSSRSTERLRDTSGHASRTRPQDRTPARGSEVPVSPPRREGVEGVRVDDARPLGGGPRSKLRPGRRWKLRRGRGGGGKSEERPGRGIVPMQTAGLGGLPVRISTSRECRQELARRSKALNGESGAQRPRAAACGVAVSSGASKPRA